MQCNNIVDETFKVKELLGQGFTSQVFKAEHIETKYELAMKVFKPMKKVNLMLENFRKEVDSMKNFRHENLINIIAANEKGIYVDNNGQSHNMMYLGIELAENAELFDFISDPGRGFSEKIARILFKQMIYGLNSMHELGVAHRDMKTENMFLDKDFNLKVGDFGFSKFMDVSLNNGLLKTQLGTLGYQSPELVEGQNYNGVDNDIFACGVILFILVNAYPPFREAKKTDNWYRHLYAGKPDFFWATHKKVKISDSLKHLITGMLSYKNRFTIKDIVQNEWFNGETESKEAYLEDMRDRKVYVDERRNKEKLENLQNNSLSGTVNEFRELSEDLVSKCEQIFEKIGDTSSFEKKTIQDIDKRNTFEFDQNDLNTVSKNLIKLIYEKFGGECKFETEKDSFSFLVDVPISSVKELESEEEDNTLNSVTCQVEFYLDQSKKKSYAVFTKLGSTNAFDYKNFLNSLSNK